MRDPLGQSSGQWSGKCSDQNSGKLMAWLDRELPHAEAATVERHGRACTESASRAEARAEGGGGELAEPATWRSVTRGGAAQRGFPRRALRWAAAGAAAAAV